MNQPLNEVIIQFLQRFLKTESLDNVEWHLEDQNAKGYCSEISKLAVTCHKPQPSESEVKYSFIVKIPYNSPIYKRFPGIDVFNTEILMYEKILPQIEQLLGYPDGGYLSPRLHGTDGNLLMILEDLNVRGYQSLGVKETLDAPFLTLVLEKLAKFHAASVKLNEINPTILEKTKSNFLVANLLRKPERAPLYMKRLETALKLLLPNQYWSKVDEYKSVYGQSVIDDLIPTPTDFKVLNHMDMWLCNLLVLKGDKIDIKLIDFQLSKWTNPAIDILYLFVTSSTYDVFKEHGQQLLESYIKVLQDTCAQLKCQCNYTFEQLKKDMKKRFSYAFYCGTIFLAATRAENREVSLDLTNHDCLKTELYKKIAAPWFEYFVQEIM